MTILELANQLKAIYDKHGDIDVLFTDPNSRDGPFAVCEVNPIEVEDDDDFPEDFNMPKGFKFVELAN